MTQRYTNKIKEGITMEVHGALAYAICAFIMVSCIYTSLALVTSAIEHLKEFWTKLKDK